MRPAAVAGAGANTGAVGADTTRDGATAAAATGAGAANTARAATGAGRGAQPTFPSIEELRECAGRLRVAAGVAFATAADANTDDAYDMVAQARLGAQQAFGELRMEEDARASDEPVLEADEEEESVDHGVVVACVHAAEAAERQARLWIDVTFVNHTATDEVIELRNESGQVAVLATGRDHLAKARAGHRWSLHCLGHELIAWTIAPGMDGTKLELAAGHKLPSRPLRRTAGQRAAMFTVEGEAKRPQWEQTTKKKKRRC